MASRTGRSCYWCFTINNPEGLLDEASLAPAVFCVYQEELGDSATHHFQGYMEFPNPVSLARVKKLPGFEGAHLEIRRGTQHDAIAYAQKEDTRVGGPYTFGSPRPGQGARSDIRSLVTDVCSGLTDAELIEKHPAAFIRYFKGVDRIRLTSAKVRTEKTLVTLVYGPPGYGKSTEIRKRAPSAYWKDASKWWDKYDGTSPVVLDDFYGWLPFHEMLRLMDCFPHQVEIKGGTVGFAPPTMFISSNKPPWEWWSEEVKKKYEITALFRRIDHVIYFHAKFEFAEMKFNEWRKDFLSLPVLEEF